MTYSVRALNASFEFRRTVLEHSINFSASSRAACYYIRLEPFGLSSVHISTIHSTQRNEERENQRALPSFVTLRTSAQSDFFQRSDCLLLPLSTTLYQVPTYFYRYRFPFVFLQYVCASFFLAIETKFCTHLGRAFVLIELLEKISTVLRCDLVPALVKMEKSWTLLHGLLKNRHG